MTMTAQEETSITSGQTRQYKRFVEDIARHGAELALKKVEADSEGWQRVLERGDELKVAVAETIVAKTCEFSLTNQFADEEVESSYGYLSGYQPKPIAEQVKRLRELFPELGSVDESIAEQELPQNTEGWFAIPRWEKIAPTYGEAVQKVLDLIKQTRDGKFHNYRGGQLGEAYLRQSAKTTKALQALGEQQSDHDILVMSAQFGLHYRGKSVRRAREVMNASEFGLGAFEIGVMLLTHLERLQHLDDLWIDCAGDEFAPHADGGFCRAPCFGFHDGKVEFGTGDVGDADGDCGSASAFSPQQS